MNTLKQFIEIIDKRCSEIGISKWELAKRAGLSETVFNMALKRNSYLRLENIEAISRILEISMIQLLGLEEKSLPDDIKTIEDLLLKIPKKDRKMILLNVKNYYDEANSKQPDLS